MIQRQLKSGQKGYDPYGPDLRGRVLARHAETGWGKRRLAEEFGVNPSTINGWLVRAKKERSA
jgi:transposase